MRFFVITTVDVRTAVVVAAVHVAAAPNTTTHRSGRHVEVHAGTHVGTRNYGHTHNHGGHAGDNGKVTEKGEAQEKTKHGIKTKSKGEKTETNGWGLGGPLT